jgi:hypothetical protein
LGQPSGIITNPISNFLPYSVHQVEEDSVKIAVAFTSDSESMVYFYSWNTPPSSTQYGSPVGNLIIKFR